MMKLNKKMEEVFLRIEIKKQTREKQPDKWIKN